MRKTNFIYVHGCMCVSECLTYLLVGTWGEQSKQPSGFFSTGFITLFSANTLLPSVIRINTSKWKANVFF